MRLESKICRNDDSHSDDQKIIIHVIFYITLLSNYTWSVAVSMRLYAACVSLSNDLCRVTIPLVASILNTPSVLIMEYETRRLIPRSLSTAVTRATRVADTEFSVTVTL